MRVHLKIIFSSPVWLISKQALIGPTVPNFCYGLNYLLPSPKSYVEVLLNPVLQNRTEFTDSIFKNESVR